MESSGVIYLVRHCATSNDGAPYPILLGQRHNYGLSDRGRAQAAVLTEYFSGKDVSAIYASPAERAVETAAAVPTEGETTYCTSLKEADMGSWEGCIYADIQRTVPEQFSAHLRDPGTYGWPGGETLVDVCRRGMRFLEKLAVDHHNERVVVVTHKYVCRAVLTHLMGVPMHRAREIDQDPGCVNVIRVFQGTMSLVAVNYTDHFYSPTEAEPCEYVLDDTAKSELSLTKVT
jgi:broad specificity phosphatase PhoE